LLKGEAWFWLSGWVHFYVFDLRDRTLLRGGLGRMESMFFGHNYCRALFCAVSNEQSSQQFCTQQTSKHTNISQVVKKKETAKKFVGPS
jgi:hypothetical protein